MGKNILVCLRLDVQTVCLYDKKQNSCRLRLFLVKILQERDTREARIDEEGENHEFFRVRVELIICNPVQK